MNLRLSNDKAKRNGSGTGFMGIEYIDYYGRKLCTKHAKRILNCFSDKE